MGETLYHEHKWYFNNWCYCHSFFHSCFNRNFFLLSCLSSLFTCFEALESPVGDLSPHASCIGDNGVLLCVNVMIFTCLSKQGKSDGADDLLLLVSSILPFLPEFNVKQSVSPTKKQGNIGSFHYFSRVTQDSSRAPPRLLVLFVSYSQMTLNFFLVYSSLLVVAIFCRVVRCMGDGREP